MQQAIEQQLTDEDTRLIEMHQLGIPQNRYTIRASMIFFLIGFGFFCLLIGIISALVILIHFLGAPLKLPIEASFLISLCFQATFCLLLGWWSLWIGIPQYRRKHAVICDQGFLQVEDTILGKRIEVVRWLEIQSAKKSLLGCVVSYQERKTCLLDGLYQNSSELTELVKQRSVRRNSPGIS